MRVALKIAKINFKKKKVKNFRNPFFCNPWAVDWARKEGKGKEKKREKKKFISEILKALVKGGKLKVLPVPNPAECGHSIESRTSSNKFFFRGKLG